MNENLLTIEELKQIVRDECAHRKRQLEFSQKVCVFCMVFVVAVWLGNLALAFTGKEPLPDVVNIGFTIFGGFVTGGYFTLCGVRDCSKNRMEARLAEANHDGEPVV